MTSEDAVAGCGQKHDSRVDGVGRARGSLQDSGIPPVLPGYRAHVHRAQEPGQIYPLPGAVTPGLGDDHGVASPCCPAATGGVLFRGLALGGTIAVTGRWVMVVAAIHGGGENDWREETR